MVEKPKSIIFTLGMAKQGNLTSATYGNLWQPSTHVGHPPTGIKSLEPSKLDLMTKLIGAHTLTYFCKHHCYFR